MRQALLDVDGVTAAEVSFQPPQAVVRYRPGLVSADALVEAVQEIGFKAHVANE